MNPFQYTRPKTEAEAIHAVLAEPNTAFIAGGTNKVDLLRQYIESNDGLVDINALPLQGVVAARSVEGVALRINALARMSGVAEDPNVVRYFPVISESLLASASPQLRNMASIGGNLMQRTRCPYFRQTAFDACNKRVPGSGCASIAGDNRTNAVLGTSPHCIATHASDLAVALAALDSVVVIHGPEGERHVPVTLFHKLPGETPHIENVLRPGELIVAVLVPPLPMAKGSHYLKVRDRASHDFALASAAVSLDVENGTIRASRIALGGVATKPWRAFAAEAALRGKPAVESSFRMAARHAVEGAVAQSRNGFKIELAQRTLVRALEECAAGATSGEVA